MDGIFVLVYEKTLTVTSYASTVTYALQLVEKIKLLDNNLEF